MPRFSKLPLAIRQSPPKHSDCNVFRAYSAHFITLFIYSRLYSLKHFKKCVPREFFSTIFRLFHEITKKKKTQQRKSDKFLSVLSGRYQVLYGLCDTVVTTRVACPQGTFSHATVQCTDRPVQSCTRLCTSFCPPYARRWQSIAVRVFWNRVLRGMWGRRGK